MIMLSQQICEELDIDYWQLNKNLDENKQPVLTLTREEKELLRKILLAKGITLDDSTLIVKQDSIVEIKLPQKTLIFDDCSLKDSENTIHLAKISDMIKDVNYKKLTWKKLKGMVI